MQRKCKNFNQILKQSRRGLELLLFSPNYSAIKVRFELYLQVFTPDKKPFWKDQIKKDRKDEEERRERRDERREKRDRKGKILIRLVIDSQDLVFGEITYKNRSELPNPFLQKHKQWYIKIRPPSLDKICSKKGLISISRYFEVTSAGLRDFEIF